MNSDQPVRRFLLLHHDHALAARLRGLLAADGRQTASLAHFTHLPDALTYARIEPVDVILAGPEPAGDELVEAVRQLSAAEPETPVLALLTSPSGDEIDAARRAGARETLATDLLEARSLTRTLEFCRSEAAISRELAQVTARLDWLVHMDSLTGLLNRKGMERALRDELARCRASHRKLLILLVDLDDFSRINATLGHGVGDLVLVGAARRIGESIREQDKAARCGTDRFVVMLPQTEESEGEVIAEKIRLAISRDVISAGSRSLTTTASLSLTAVSSTSLSFDEVMANAHFVLQRGKLAGKNRVARAASVDSGAVKPVLAGPDMVRALLQDEVLEVSSQPVVNLQDGRIVSREMLIRGPAGPLRRPDNLFRFCQENDILPAVDLRCLKLCAAAAARLGAAAAYHVNIMPATVLQTDADELLRVLLVGKTDGHCCLEISEQQLLGDPSVLVPRVRTLQEAGVRIAIDDVGFGNSCLEGLIMLHPEVMKIDKRLVRGLAVDPEMRRALARMLRVADVLEAEVVAEGIETTEDFHVLLDMGVRFGQGYLFGRPLLCAEDPVMNGKGAPAPETATDTPASAEEPGEEEIPGAAAEA